MFTPRVLVIKCQKWFAFCVFCWWQQKLSHSLGKIFRCIWLWIYGVMFSSQFDTNMAPIWLWHSCLPVKFANFSITNLFIEKLRTAPSGTVIENSLSNSAQGEKFLAWDEKLHIMSTFSTLLTELKFPAQAHNIHIISLRCLAWFWIRLCTEA